MPEAAQRAGSLTPVLDALGAAWTVYGLYPNPSEQPGLQRAAQAFTDITEWPVSVEVGADGFLVDGQLLPIGREGTNRLARRLFVHAIEELAVSGPPSVDDLIAFFGLVTLEEETVRSRGGIETALRSTGVATLSVRARSLFQAPDVDPIERAPEVEAALVEGEDPEEFARTLVDESGRDPDRLAAVFHDRYVDVYGRVADGDIGGREEGVRVFVETFFHLPRKYQIAAVGQFLDRQELPESLVFLDQFAGHDLAGLAPGLSPGSYALLLDYAKLSTDGADKRPDELLALLDQPETAVDAREAIAGTIQRRVGEAPESIGTAGESFENIRRQMPSPETYESVALDVLRGLIEIEERDRKFRRVLRMWTGKVTKAIRDGDLSRAERWLEAGSSSPHVSESRRGELHAAQALIAESDVIAALTAKLNSPDREVAERLLRTLGGHAAETLMELLAEEQDRLQRRVLMEVLAIVGRTDPSKIIAGVEGAPWYVRRNLVAVLGKTRRPEAVDVVVAQLRHEDHRVRTAALRALVPLLGERSVPYLARAVAEFDETVSQAAVGLLGALKYESATDALIEILGHPATNIGAKRRAIDSLAQRGARGRAALEEVAARRSFRSGVRELRDAARTALRHPA